MPLRDEFDGVINSCSSIQSTPEPSRASSEPKVDAPAIAFRYERQRTAHLSCELACCFPASAIASEPKSAALILLRLLA